MYKVNIGALLLLFEGSNVTDDAMKFCKIALSCNRRNYLNWKSLVSQAF